MKSKTSVKVLFSLFTFIFCLVLSVSAQNLTVREIMAEPSIAGQRVEGEKLSPDGTKVIFLWNADGKLPRDLYMVPASGGTPQIILRVSDLPSSPPRSTPENKLDYGLIVRDDFVKAREVGLGNFEWSPDSKRLLFTQAGDLYVFTIGGGKPKRYTKTQAAEVGARFIDNDRILYQQAGNIFVLNISDATTVQLTREADPARFISVGGGTVSKDGKMLAYTVSDSSKFRPLFVPNYLGEFTEAPTFRRGWSEQKLYVVPTDASRDAPFEIKLPKQEGVGGFRRTAWAADGRSLMVDRVDKDTKRRQLFYVHNVASKDEKIITVSDETDDKWQASLSVIFEPNPKDPSQLFFCSEKDGFNHLYMAKVDPATGTAESKQLTKGPWQVEWAKWTAGGNAIAYSSTEESADERQFYFLNAASGEKTKLQSYEKGMKISPQMDEVNPVPTLLYSFSQWQTPDELYAQKVCDACKEGEAVNRLTKTVPASFDARKWNAPRFVDIPSRDGKKIASKFYRPADFDPKKKYPMVIFVHGAGYLQNTINGWNNYYREFMFNDLLTRRGYVVLDIDYRGSAGYGRDWRTDVYDFLGGKDYDDHIDAIDFMVKNYAVDPNKVGVYGGSYGGFMAEMLIFRAPDKVAAAAALRPVADWKNYYASSPTYTAQRLGFPDKNPEAYKRSSPISYADKLQKPLLILHGMVDDNVHVQDSQQLIEKLIRLGKTQYFEAMLYPSENHGFVRPESWADEYERILAFFEKHLK
ncbi:MAG TPA: alpha/beta fold hydrolase [Pyrinomonadaceae bacterium]|nr:alpha/beta fold hydrolase [Pyrinomonadaceae bacterium]